MENKYIWQWCWFCDCATIDSPNNEENTCCAFWGDKANLTWYNEVLEYLRSRPDIPKVPTQKHIDQLIERALNPSEFDKNISKIFNLHPFSESEYYKAKKWVDKESLIIPSLEELHNQLNGNIDYDCKTGFDWNEQEKKYFDIIDPIGWTEDTYLK